MANDAGFGSTTYTPTPPLTEFAIDCRAAHAARLVYLGARNSVGSPLWFGTKTNDAAAGSPIAATRLDSAGSASGELTYDDFGMPYALFDEPIAAGLWRFAVTEPE